MPFPAMPAELNALIMSLAANIPLIKRNLAPLSFVDVPQDIYVDGMLAIYELNRIELLRDVFVWAYERSCQRYTLIKQALPEPDPLRLRYRDALTHVVGEVVRSGSAVAPAIIRQLAGTAVAADDVAALIAMAINELANLHEGNIALYRRRLSEFHHWRGQSPA